MTQSPVALIQLECARLLRFGGFVDDLARDICHIGNQTSLDEFLGWHGEAQDEGGLVISCGPFAVDRSSSSIANGPWGSTGGQRASRTHSRASARPPADCCPPARGCFEDDQRASRRAAIGHADGLHASDRSPSTPSAGRWPSRCPSTSQSRLRINRRHDIPKFQAPN